jgi:hypothetical protein
LGTYKVFVALSQDRHENDESQRCEGGHRGDRRETWDRIHDTSREEVAVTQSEKLDYDGDRKEGPTIPKGGGQI